MKSLVFSLFLFLLFCVGANAQCREAGTIRVPKGQTTATVSGSLTAAKAVCYKFRGKAGQAVSAVLSSPNKSMRFSIVPDAFDVDDEETGDTTSWTGKLSGNYGDKYIVSIHTSKSSGSYVLKMTFK